ncbi:SUPPRESSOR OF GAMMA RESPONSE 1-like [Lolium rigidum]|uniref:SUPPRESSOR OF GAMMA RESPONSE 1-like n=1 Tax=Lolium rigidum TaxID=89674 RepID=UPI001F5DBF9A|nr:SUPPRESSOR OF GAMMA RESPONSE 1-like [Lolium rigidum]
MAKRSSLVIEPSRRGEGCLLPWGKHCGERHGGHVVVFPSRAYLRARSGHPHAHLITCPEVPFPPDALRSLSPRSALRLPSPVPDRPGAASRRSAAGRPWQGLASLQYCCLLVCDGAGTCALIAAWQSLSLIINGKIIAAMIRNSSIEIKELIATTWKECASCEYHMHNDDVSSQWPGLPVGVKFDPTDQELLRHLEGKVGRAASHVLIDNFIPTIKEEEGICYTHPENLPGIKMDGSSSHFFHKISNAYEVGKRKRRKISNSIANDCDETITWHKTGKSSRILDNGVIKGWKKILVLHQHCNGEKVKTNWTMHQCHLGAAAGEKHGELVVSRVFWRVKNNTGKSQMHAADAESGSSAVKINPTTPNMYPPLPRHLSCSPLETERNQNEEEPGSSAVQGYAALPPLCNADIHENSTPLNLDSTFGGFTDFDSILLSTLPEFPNLIDSFD